MLTSFGHTGRSTHVEMRLLINGASLSIAQMGPDFLLLDKPIDHPPSEATIALSVDGNERRWPVRLPEGIFVGCERLVIAKAGMDS